jgi:hypothetical protein
MEFQLQKSPRHRYIVPATTPTIAKEVYVMATKQESTGQKVAPRKRPTTRKTASKSTELRDNGAKAVLTTAVDPDTRRQLVAAEAYFLAERRGFAAGNELADWIAAEAAVDSRLQQMRVA